MQPQKPSTNPNKPVNSQPPNQVSSPVQPVNSTQIQPSVTQTTNVPTQSQISATMQPSQSTVADTQSSAMVQPDATSPQPSVKSNSNQANAQQVPRITLQSPQGEMLEPNRPVPSVVRWTAKEYISPDKSIVWYIGLTLAVVGGIALDVFVLKSWTVSMLVVAIAAVLVVMSVRPARDINYELSDEGLNLGDVQYQLNEYRAFGVLHDGKANSIYLMPVKRFKPGLSVYFPVESGEQIVDFLSSRMPMQEVKLDFIDRIVRLFRL